MPCSIRQFPSSAFSATYVWILNVRAGATVDIVWYWEFEETYQPQNEAQGDSLSFNINYLLGDMPPPRPGMAWMKMNVLGNPNTILLDSEGRAVDNFLAESKDRSVAVLVAVGTRLWTYDDTRAITPLDSIMIKRSENSRSTAKGMAIIGSAINIDAYCNGQRVSGRIADGPLTLIMSYDPSLLPSVTRMIGIYLFSEGEWSPLPPSMGDVMRVGQCSAYFNRGGEMAIIASFDPQQAAYLLPTALSIESSSKVFWGPIELVRKSGDVVSVVLTLINVGEINGTRDITLFINGKPVKSEKVSLGPLEKGEIRFEVTGLGEGSYDIEILGMKEQVEIRTEINWSLILPFLGLGLFIPFALVRSAITWRQTQKNISQMRRRMMELESKLLHSDMALTVLSQRQKSILSHIQDKTKDIKTKETATLESTLPASPQSGYEIQISEIEDKKASQPSSEGLRNQSMKDIKIRVMTSNDAINSDSTWGTIMKSSKASAADPLARAEQKIIQEEEFEVRRLRIAKDFILTSIRQRGQIALENVPRNKNAELAMKALAQLIEEGKILAVQQDHKVVYVLAAGKEKDD
ncbi:MAG: hypothetical protein QW520_07875 [Methanomassiliicoccales archaeon]